MSKPTIKDVARAANVSVGTASMALNNKKGVNEQTQRLVLQVAEELCYVPNHSARSLVTNSSNLIGLVIPEIVNPFYSAIVDQMTRLAEENGYTLLLGISNNKPHLEKEYLHMFLSRNVQGVVIVPMLRKEPPTGHLQLLRSSGVPFVFCTERYMDCGEPCAMCDFEQGEYDLIRYLLEKGLQRIAFLTTDYDAHFAVLRMNGFQKAHRDLGLQVDPEDVFYLDGPIYDDAYKATDQVLTRKPEAIVTINDIMAIGVMKRLSERGIRVPEDISVAGFDNMMFAALAQKPITTVAQPLLEICSRCMELLNDRIQHRLEGKPNRPGNYDRIDYFHAGLIVRESTI